MIISKQKSKLIILIKDNTSIFTFYDVLSSKWRRQSIINKIEEYIIYNKCWI